MDLPLKGPRQIHIHCLYVSRARNLLSACLAAFSSWSSAQMTSKSSLCLVSGPQSLLELLGPALNELLSATAKQAMRPEEGAQRAFEEIKEHTAGVESKQRAKRYGNRDDDDVHDDRVILL